MFKWDQGMGKEKARKKQRKSMEKSRDFVEHAMFKMYQVDWLGLELLTLHTGWNYSAGVSSGGKRDFRIFEKFLFHGLDNFLCHPKMHIS